MWILIFALPDLNISESIGNENIAIVPHDDSRIIKITNNSVNAKALVNNFKDQFGRERHPSFLIINDTAPMHLRNIDAIVGFRNIIAISTIIEGHEHNLIGTFVTLPLYSDYFDFYPITITKDNDAFLTQSPSVLGYDRGRNKFSGQTSPSLADSRNIRAERYNHLFDQLHKVWQRRYLKNKQSEWSTRILFRSIEMAYQASAMPFKNHSTIYDYGASASLWVSAFEILSHPKKGNANLLTVLNLLGKYEWLHKDLRRRSYVIKYGGKRMHVNLSQKLYKELYDTRNAFLHGNPIAQNRLKPFGNKNAEDITRFAPLLYKVALLKYLEQFKDRRIKPNWQDTYIRRVHDERNLCNALLEAKSPTPDM